jgi:hypothetical protein
MLDDPLMSPCKVCGRPALDPRKTERLQFIGHFSRWLLLCQACYQERMQGELPRDQSAGEADLPPPAPPAPPLPPPPPLREP